jgi:hypothetical protein
MLRRIKRNHKVAKLYLWLLKLLNRIQTGFLMTGGAGG